MSGTDVQERPSAAPARTLTLPTSERTTAPTFSARMTSALRYIALGDSTGVGVGAHDGRGYVARLHERLLALVPDARLVNLCISGATSEQVVARQLPRALAELEDGSIASVFVGINDLVRGVSPVRFGEQLEQLARTLAQQQVPTLLCTLPDLVHAPAARTFMQTLGVAGSLFETRTLAFNAEVQAVARKHQLRVADLFEVPLADRAHFFCDDGFHPSAQGYEELTTQLWPVFSRLLPRSR